jgi:modulator of FtsH protease HflK
LDAKVAALYQNDDSGKDYVEKARDVTRTRLYLEAMEKVLAKVQLYVIDSDKGRVPLHLRMTGQSR